MLDLQARYCQMPAIFVWWKHRKRRRLGDLKVVNNRAELQKIPMDSMPFHRHPTTQNSLRLILAN